MKRTKIPVDGLPLWRVKSPTYTLSSGKLLRKGDQFHAELDDIPVAFRDAVMHIEGKLPEDSYNEPMEYSLKRAGGPWFDVVDAHGKAINEKRLRKEQAEELLKELVS